MQKQATADIPPHHIIPVGNIPKILGSHSSVHGVNMSHIGTCHHDEISLGDFFVGCPGADDCEGGEKEEYVAHL